MTSSTFFKLATGATFFLPGYPAKENGTSVIYTKLDAVRARDEFGRVWSFSPSLAIGAQGTEGQSGAVPASTGTGGTGTTGARGPKGDKGDKGDPGTPGAAGSPGAAGASGGLLYRFSSDVTITDPGVGVLKFDSDPATLSELLISKTTNDSQPIEGLLATWGASTSAVRSIITIVKDGFPSVFVVLEITSGVQDNITWDEFGAVLLSASAGSINAGDLVRVFFSNTGDAGAAGGTPHVVIPSNSSVLIATGSKSFAFTSAIVVPDTVGWDIGTRVAALSAADPTNFMAGAVTAITMAASPTRAVSVTVLVDSIGGSGTFSDFTLSIAGSSGGGSGGTDVILVQVFS